jgi:hypothetical protein
MVMSHFRRSPMITMLHRQSRSHGLIALTRVQTKAQDENVAWTTQHIMLSAVNAYESLAMRIWHCSSCLPVLVHILQLAESYCLQPCNSRQE